MDYRVKLFTYKGAGYLFLPSTFGDPTEVDDRRFGIAYFWKEFNEIHNSYLAYERFNHIGDGIFMDTYPLADLQSFTGRARCDTGARRIGQTG